ncbi:transposase, partial [Arthrospira platensis SPKY1]|nr:transposase [Arthrospira platensis SPKY1]
GAKNILHITCKAARKLFVFRGKKKKRCAQFSERKVFVENTLCKLCHTWQADLLTFNLMDNHMHIGIGFDPLPFKLMSDREIIERACDLDVKSEKRGRFTPAQRKRWIEKQLADPAAVAQWRENFMTPSVFMKYLNEAVSRFINKQENTQGTLWSRPFHATRIDDPRGLLTAMMYIDLNQIRAGMTRNLEECMHSGIYYRMVDPDTLPKE